jgi:hypothetical protein
VNSRRGSSRADNRADIGGSILIMKDVGMEYPIAATPTGIVNQCGNKADDIGIPKRSALSKCRTFPAMGPCE